MPIPNVEIGHITDMFIHPRTGNLFFTDGNKRRIYKYCPITSEVIFILKFQSQCVDPQAVWVTNDEQTMYYTQSHTIRKMNLKSGECEIICGTGLPSFNGDGKPGKETMISDPKSLKLYEEDNELYFYCVGNQRIRKINSYGIVETIWSLNDCPELKESFDLTSHHTSMGISSSKKLIYLTFNIDKGRDRGLFKFDMETKEFTCIYKKKGANFQYFNDEIYVNHYGTIYKVDSNGTESKFYKHSSISCIGIANNNKAYIWETNSSKQINQGLILNTDDFTLSSPFMQSNEKKDFNNARQFFFFDSKNEEYSLFNIPKLDRDLKTGNVICFTPLLQKVAPKLSKYIETNGQELNSEVIQYLVDYCIYHDYSDFKGADTAFLKNVKAYFKWKPYDPIFTPLVEYLESILGSKSSKNETSEKKRKIDVEEYSQDPIRICLSDLLNDNTTSDFSIFLDGNEWKCHKTILSRSKFFQTMLEGSVSSFSDVNENAFYIDKDTNSKVAEIIIKYCYDINPDTNKLSSSEFIELMEFAKLHEMESLGKDCVENLVLTVENFRPLAQFIAQFENEQFPSLQQRLIQFALQNTHDVIEQAYEGNMSQLPSFIISSIMCALPQWVVFQLMKQVQH